MCAHSVHVSFHSCCYVTGSCSCVHTNPPKTKAESEKDMKEEWLLANMTDTTNTNRLPTILNKRSSAQCAWNGLHAKLTVEKTPVWKDRNNRELTRVHSLWNVICVLTFFLFQRADLRSRPYANFYQNYTWVTLLNFTATSNNSISNIFSEAKMFGIAEKNGSHKSYLLRKL